jgi:hypothetical protein
MDVYTMTFATSFITTFAALEALSAIISKGPTEDPTNREVIIMNATWALVYETVSNLGVEDPDNPISDIIAAVAAEGILKKLYPSRAEPLGDAIIRFTAVNVAKAII